MTDQAGKPKAGSALAGLGVLGAIAFKFKAGLLALLKFSWLGKSFLTMFLSIGFYAMFFGLPYALAIVLLLFIHEGGHWIWMKALGLNPQAPMFVPGIGAYVAMTNLPSDAATRAWVAFAGPLVGGVSSAAMYWGGAQLGNGWLMAAGSTGFWLNLLQLVPAKPLDGGFVVQAISKWLLLPGAIILLLLAWKFASTLLLIIAVIAGFSVFNTLFRRNAVPAMNEPTPASMAQKFIIGIAYVSLAGMLAYLYVLSMTTVTQIMHRN
jgi:Zn-dependent protease